MLTHPGDIDPRRPGRLTITLDPMPTPRETRAVAELCEHLTATNTVYPGTNRTLHYQTRLQQVGRVVGVFVLVSVVWAGDLGH